MDGARRRGFTGHRGPPHGGLTCVRHGGYLRVVGRAPEGLRWYLNVALGFHQNAFGRREKGAALPPLPKDAAIESLARLFSPDPAP